MSIKNQPALKNRRKQNHKQAADKKPISLQTQSATALQRMQNAPDLLTAEDIVTLQQTLGNQALAQMLSKAQPKSPTETSSVSQSNKPIQRALASPRFTGDTTLEQIEQGHGTLKKGDDSTSVSKVQHAIHDAGVLFLGFGVDGKFGRETARRVRTFQRRKGVSGDPVGEVGENTIKELDSLFPAMALPANSSDAYSFAGMKAILSQWNSAMLQDLKTMRVRMVADLFWADERFDGANWVADPTPGAGETSGTSIIIATNNSNEEVAKTLYHEYQHARQPRSFRTGWGDEEQRAFTMETQWAIDRGLTVDASLTTTDPNTGDVSVDSAGVDATVESYPGLDSANPGEVIGKVGANRVRVRLPSGRRIVRNAVVDDTVAGPRRITGPIHAVRPSEWD